MKKEKESAATGGVFLAKNAGGDYRAGQELTTDPAASFALEGKAPRRVHPARLAAWLRDGTATVARKPEPEKSEPPKPDLLLKSAEAKS